MLPLTAPPISSVTSAPIHQGKDILHDRRRQTLLHPEDFVRFAHARTYPSTIVVFHQFTSIREQFPRGEYINILIRTLWNEGAGA
jgi:hypothetical protein